MVDKEEFRKAVEESAKRDGVTFQEECKIRYDYMEKNLSSPFAMFCEFDDMDDNLDKLFYLDEWSKEE